tara:strand:- start:760 stop:1386 length:627 start_codon:yes stop_codon:yes gene_type:complete
MADFENRIDALTGFGTGTGADQADITDWLVAGARAVIDVLSPTKLQRIASTTTFQDSQDVEGKKIISVMRKDENNSSKLMPCRQVSPALKGRVTDPSYMEAASTSDPVYYIESDVLNVVPTHSDSNSSSLVNIDLSFSGLTYDDTSIANFPDEAENAVVLFAARNALEKKIKDANAAEDLELAAALIAQYQVIDSQYKEQIQILQGSV